MAEYDADVIIVGAGIAGLTAANKFEQQGISYLILEATDRIGGRLKSHNFKGTVVEAGANWITGADDANPIFDIGVNELDLDGVYSEEDNFWFRDCVTGTDKTEAGNDEIDLFETY
jgi:phytoene dehydrogenase-like protein